MTCPSVRKRLIVAMPDASGARAADALLSRSTWPIPAAAWEDLR